MIQYAIATFFTSICTFVLGFFVLFQQPKLLRNQIFCFFSLSVAAWSCFLFFNVMAKDQSSALIFVRLLHACSMLITISFLHLTLVLSGTLKKRATFLKIAYIIVIATLLLDLSPWLVNARYLEGFNFFAAKPELFYPLHLAVFFGFHLYAFWVLFVAFLQSKGAERNQIAYFLVATSIGYSGGTANYLLNYGIKIFPFWPFGNYTIVAFVSILAYAITKHELMDIRVVITRAMAYGVVVFLLVGSFVGFNLMDLPPAARVLGNVLLGLFWAYAAHRLREFIQTPLEEKWITGWYDSDRLINTIARKLVPVMERQEAFRITADELKSAIKIKKVDVLTGSECPDIKEVRRVGKGVEIPFISSEGLEGVLRLGEKVSEDPYDDKDLRLFDTLQVQILAILDRIQPYERIKKDFEANQKKLYDAERLLARSEKIASMANSIREYNHEIKIPLTVMRSELYLLPDKPGEIKDVNAFKKCMIEEIKRVDDIVESTLRLSELKERHVIELDLNDIVNETLKQFPPSRVRLIKELNPLPLIMADKDDLQIVFINLIKNAVEAMPKGGDLKISTYSGVEEDKPVVYAEVSDTGVGIPEENINKIFDAFFSTHVTKGRGLGLAIVFRIIREHDGTINVISKVGKGTTFKVSL
ncbi:MAG: GHKL domain-containing protein [Candidatus Saganbacteria bacterium]|nr:GHKL domain-containing protein [Candidatus Saganbacteria bacterium]